MEFKMDKREKFIKNFPGLYLCYGTSKFNSKNGKEKTVNSSGEYRMGANEENSDFYNGNARRCAAIYLFVQGTYKERI